MIADDPPLESEPAPCFRFRSSRAVDIDAYQLEQGAFALFAHVKKETAASAEESTTWVAEFERPVAVVGRARKTGARSMPLPGLWRSADGVYREAPPASGTELWAAADGLRFLLEMEGVLNPGLFLDQRSNRRSVTERVRAAVAGGAENVRALNLFSYTGAFSLAALTGGASATTSVDSSSRYLAWEGRNLARNFPSRAEACRLLRDDARSFVRRARKRGDTYSFVVIDPPTFSRGKKPFRARQDLPELAREAVGCLEPRPGAALFVSTNDAGWPVDAFLSDLERAIRSADLRVEPGLIPPDFPPDHALRSAWLTRR